MPSASLNGRSTTVLPNMIFLQNMCSIYSANTVCTVYVYTL